MEYNMKEIILCKYGEIVLKGLNRGHFESLLETDMRKRLKKLGDFRVTRAQSTLYIEPLTVGVEECYFRELQARKLNR
jgi:thiamine biosynthesis protein ThiI